MDVIQVSFFFLISYLLSRVFVVLKIPELILYYLFEKKHVSVPKLTFVLILGTSLISSIIANVITVLTLLPLVLLLQKEVIAIGKNVRKLNTLFLLSFIWGGNIGGIGMVTGTTTNGILIGLYEIYKIPIAKSFTFISWMAWGIPLVLLLCIAGWLILMLVFQPGKNAKTHDFAEQLSYFSLSRRLQKVGFRLAISFAVTASALSYLLTVLDQHKHIILFATIIWTLVYLYLILFHDYQVEDGSKVRLLKFRDTLADIPKKGLLWIGLGILITYLIWQARLHIKLGNWLTVVMEGRHSIFWTYMIFALLATFATELVSNSAVQVTMFMVLFPMTKYNPDLSWQGMLIITLCSACAFMTPLATPSNGLGFGSSRRLSYKYMFFSGFIMNLVSASLISVWVFYVVPRILILFA